MADSAKFDRFPYLPQGEVQVNRIKQKTNNMPIFLTKAITMSRDQVHSFQFSNSVVIMTSLFILIYLSFIWTWVCLLWDFYNDLMYHLNIYVIFICQNAKWAQVHEDLCLWAQTDSCMTFDSTPWLGVDWIYAWTAEGKRFKQLCKYVHDVADEVISKRQKALVRFYIV